MKNQENASFRKEIGLFFDNQLDQNAQMSFISKVEKDSFLKTTFNREKNVRELLRNSVQRSHVSPDLIQSIKSKIKLG